jgi:ribosome-associated protein
MPKTAKTSKSPDWIHTALMDAKANDVVLLDVRKISDFTDYMVVATGTSSRHVQSTSDKVVDALRARGVRAVGVEGKKTGDWVLIDFGDVVVHIMRAEVRDFYNLEKLWSDAKRLPPGKKPSAEKKPRVSRKPTARAKKPAAASKAPG